MKTLNGGFAPEEQSERLVARSDCELDGKKLQQIFPDIMNIKSSLIKHVQGKRVDKR